MRRALTWFGFALLFLAFVALIWFGAKVLLLAFAGVLLAVVLRVPMGVLERRLGLPDRLAYTVVLLALIALSGGLALLIGPRLLTQASEFASQLPGFLNEVRDFLEQRPWGRWLVDRVGSGPGTAGTEAESAPSPGQVAADVRVVLQYVTLVLADIVFALVMALFLSFNPELYRRGLVRLFPAPAQQRAAEVVDELGRTLQAWLVGQLALMLITGLLTGIGLFIIGIPLALGLAVFVGLMEFIPLVGPILGFIPIVIMAAAEGWTALISVGILYLAVQQVEGNILTPLVQQRVVDLPPGLTVAAVFLGGALFGPLGVILGTPLMAVVFVLVKMLYVHDVLGQTVEVPGKREPA
jgi:predicted PurR-regulated permease PerM